MICPNCSTINETENLFCVNCGAVVTVAPNTNSGISLIAENQPPPTVQFDVAQQLSNKNFHPVNSIETAVVPLSQMPSVMANYGQPMPAAADYQTKKSSLKFVWIGLIAILAMIAAAGGIYFIGQQKLTAEVLPDHLGMFFQNREKDKIDEVKKLDFTNALTGRDSLLKDDSLPIADSDPNVILYLDGKDIPINDLRLIQIDTIKDDGSFKQLDFQAAPVEGKPEMKRIRIPEGIANGKYAFALMDGFLNDGKHKFWAFQVKSASKSDNGEMLKAASLVLKPNSSTPTKSTEKTYSPTIPAKAPPPAGQSAYSTNGKLVLRSGPTQNSAKIRNLYQGERVYIIEYSGNYESFKNLYSNFAYVQTESGQRGWAYAAYLR